MSDQLLNFKYRKGKQEVYPAHFMVKNWLFKEDEHEEATLANSMAEVALKNGMSANDLQHLFPAVLRMLKSESDWVK